MLLKFAVCSIMYFPCWATVTLYCAHEYMTTRFIWLTLMWGLEIGFGKQNQCNGLQLLLQICPVGPVGEWNGRAEPGFNGL